MFTRNSLISIFSNSVSILITNALNSLAGKLFFLNQLFDLRFGFVFHNFIYLFFGCAASGHVGSSQNPGLKSCLLHWRVDSLPLSNQGSPGILFISVLLIVFSVVVSFLSVETNSSVFSVCWTFCISMKLGKAVTHPGLEGVSLYELWGFLASLDLVWAWVLSSAGWAGSYHLGRRQDWR